MKLIKENVSEQVTRHIYDDLSKWIDKLIGDMRELQHLKDSDEYKEKINLLNEVSRRIGKLSEEVIDK